METVQVKISKRVVTEALQSKPDYDSQTAHLSRLIERGLDASFTLGKPSSSHSSLSESEVLPLSLKEEEERAREAKAFAAAVKSKPAEYTPGFNAFWTTYQSCPQHLKVTGQTKPRAFEAYKAALKKTSADDLQKAAQKAVEGQLEAARRDEWAAKLPDAFRWLRDGKYEALLEDHAPAQTKPAHWL